MYDDELCKGVFEFLNVFALIMCVLRQDLNMNQFNYIVILSIKKQILPYLKKLILLDNLFSV